MSALAAFQMQRERSLVYRGIRIDCRPHQANDCDAAIAYFPISDGRHDTIVCDVSGESVYEVFGHAKRLYERVVSHFSYPRLERCAHSTTRGKGPSLDFHTRHDLFISQRTARDFDTIEETAGDSRRDIERQMPLRVHSLASRYQPTAANRDARIARIAKSGAEIGSSDQNRGHQCQNDPFSHRFARRLNTGLGIFSWRNVNPVHS